MVKKIARKARKSSFSRSKKKSSKRTVKAKAAKTKAKTVKPAKKVVRKAQVTFIPEPWSKVTKYKKIKKENDFGYW